ncbi:Similar to Drc3: Dynein regulatory complex subunit 3 (Rattus norvegicus) [Cotesia congregata]|uniref:Dynein axonemal assembly factor 1 homolog n=1 Tax=Cotesia congregata TaxID=51543 RepID=A0A8J2H8U1_COTCN|nr:Similar to Drc3: Dynein regulatory complex subunit 3 (Rattus norvegicus) [Cotesia congregata]
MSKLNYESYKKNISIDEPFSVIYDVPDVINYSTLVNLIIEQAPKGERGRLFREDGIKLDEVNEIRIEFSKILKIDHLWIMTNLTKLILSHNIIDKIENLDALVNLEDLDLSFNRIKKMENLNCLVKLQVLLIAGNKIYDIENIDNLKNLNIFSIADNKIDKWDHVLYLRKFKNLRSVNITGNPCTLQENYNNYLIALLPQVIYFSYVLISKEERNDAIKKYRQAIIKVKEEESNIKIKMNKQQKVNRKTQYDSLCFVDQLDGDEFFNTVFQDDQNGIILKNLNNDTLEVYEEYKKKFTTVCQELYKFGVDQHVVRAKEIDEFFLVVQKARENVRDEARQIIETIKTERNGIFNKFDDLVKSDKKSNEQEIKIDIKIAKTQELADELNESLTNMWTKLMYSEVVLHEQIEDIFEIFKINITDLKDSFVEFVRKIFSQIRDIFLRYREVINTVINNYLSSGGDLMMSANFVDICGDIDVLNNTLIASHDIHIQIVDNREDSIIERINLWLEELLYEFSK